MKKALNTAYYEARMSSRGWRFWLLIGLVAGISFFARSDYLSNIEEGNFLHSAYSFQHPSFWLMITIIGLGAVALSLDTCGRLRRNRMDQILFPLPFEAMELMWGRWLGVLLTIIPVSALGLFSLGLWQYAYGHGAVIWQPFIIAYGLLVLPIILPITSLAIMLRTYFKHDLTTLLAGTVIIMSSGWVNEQTHLFIEPAKITELLANASPTLGARITYGQHLLPLLVHFILSFTILYLSPLYLRRQEPQRKRVTKTQRIRIFGIPTFWQWLNNLKIDRHLGWRYRMGLAGCLLICTASVLWAAYSYQENLSNPLLVRQMTDYKVNETLPLIDVDVLNYDIEVIPTPRYDRLDLSATFEFIPNESTRQLGFELNPTFVVDDVLWNNESCLFTQSDEKLRVMFGDALTPAEQQQLVFNYHGVPPAFHPTYSALQSIWYPYPWKKIQTKLGNRWVKVEDELFEANITLHLNKGQSGAFAGERTTLEKEGKNRVEEWTTFYPVNSLQIFWGNYQPIDVEKEDYQIRFYHLPTHDYQSYVYLEEIKEQEEYINKKLGSLPFPQLTLIETPYQQVHESQGISFNNRRRYDQRGPVSPPVNIDAMMPGMLTVSENLLSYMHERMWLLERRDRDPRTIPFFLMLPTVLQELHAQFYDSLITTYFDHSLHPTGKLAFWLEKYLDSYARKLLIQSSWWRKRAMQFDIGTNSNLPLSVARRDNLLTLYQEGNYPKLLEVRGEGLFRMIHHLLGDEKWWELMKQIFRDYRFKEFPVEDFLHMVESYYGEDISWFLDDWIYGTALPNYEITLAEAKAEENKDSNRVDYHVVIRVKNHGTGKAPVPIFIETEMDYIFRNLMLDEGEEKSLKLTVPHRPIFAVVDPENWIIQEPYYNKEKRIRAHSERRIFIQGGDNSALQRSDRDRGRHRRRRFWW